MAESQSTALPPLEERPLVTFALFAYNQEKYIREAVEGAFAQTYEPLEIILSDDCSTDRTFEIMEEMAAEYKGPHIIKTRRNVRNIGTLNHVIEVGRSSLGRYIIVAAGDDVSLPERAAKQVALLRGGYWAVSGSYRELSEAGVALREVELKSESYLTNVGRLTILNIHGGTAGYDSRLFSYMGAAHEKVLVEDYALAILLFAIKKPIGFCRETVVLHRIHSNNVGIKDRSLEGLTPIQIEEKYAKKANQIETVLRYVLTLDCIKDGSCRELKLQIKRYAKYMHYLSRWMNSEIDERLMLLCYAVYFRFTRVGLVKVFGPKVYCLLVQTRSKLLPNR